MGIEGEYIYCEQRKDRDAQRSIEDLQEVLESLRREPGGDVVHGTSVDGFVLPRSRVRLEELLEVDAVARKA